MKPTLDRLYIGPIQKRQYGKAFSGRFSLGYQKKIVIKSFGKV